MCLYLGPQSPHAMPSASPDVTDSTFKYWSKHNIEILSRWSDVAGEESDALIDLLSAINPKDSAMGEI